MSKKRRQPRPRPEPAEYDYHLPVMGEEACDWLVTNPNGIYIDGTLGGGGHAANIIRRLDSGGKLYAFDKDEEAIAHCERRFAGELSSATSRIVILNKCFSTACSIEEIRGKVSGILLDLGVSSRQLDTEQVGLSYRVESPLDMRFGAGGVTAEELINHSTEEELENILRKFGEEPFARKIARRIAEKRRAIPFKTTFDLRAAVEECVPKKLHFKSLSRTFQAIRIAVNRELDVLESTLNECIPELVEGGRVVVMSYHSLEDRIVKNIFRELAGRRKEDPSYIKILTKKPITASDEEIHRNPRARSVKVRIAEKLADPGDHPPIL
ncbi:MAG: 16S rRNA (cytosine(1402)-N(4))-methyltransferase RsmH [Candidatus Kapaibacterium sp.]